MATQPSKGSGSTVSQAQISSLSSVVSDLKNALMSTDEQADQEIQDSINKINQKSRDFSQFGQQSSGSEAKRLYDDAVKALNEAADMGYDSARKALRNMGAFSAQSSMADEDVTEEEELEE